MPNFLEKRESTFRFYDKPRDLAFFNKISMEPLKIGVPITKYKCLNVENTVVDEVFGESTMPVYNPPVELYLNFQPPQIILELLQFGLSPDSTNTLNVAVNRLHFMEQTGREYPHEGDKALVCDGGCHTKAYKITKVVKDGDNVFYGETFHYYMTMVLTEEGF